MEALWFAIASLMLAAYAILDGFDFGAGVLHRVVARTDEERKVVLAAIGPVWDGNEVWLIAAGGVLFMAFPRAYSAAFSGFYMPLMMVLWLLILRGISIEFRLHADNPIGRELWDSVFSLASALLAIVLGAAIGNVARGVPVDANGEFVAPLFTNFLASGRCGVLDWYTVLVGLFALILLAAHGALYLAWKTAGPVHDRAWRLAGVLWRVVVPLWLAATAATSWVQWEIFANLIARPWSWLLVAVMVAGLVGVVQFMRQGRELAAFLSSCGFMLGVLGATMAGNYPYWLRSTLDPAYGLTAAGTAASAHGLRLALAWWIPGILLAVGYFCYLFRSMRGKVNQEIPAQRV